MCSYDLYVILNYAYQCRFNSRHQQTSRCFQRYWSAGFGPASDCCGRLTVIRKIKCPREYCGQVLSPYHINICLLTSCVLSPLCHMWPVMWPPCVCLCPLHRDFLPRGSGVVTRRPLVLQLYSIPHPGQAPKDTGSSDGAEDHQHGDSEPFYPLDDEHGYVTGRSGRRGDR
jgi:hypothetical protein